MSIASFFRRPGNEWALQMAKHNLVKHYLVVGITEQLGDFVAVLEAALPRFFAGATELYQSGTVRNSQVAGWSLKTTFFSIVTKSESLLSLCLSVMIMAGKYTLSVFILMSVRKQHSLFPIFVKLFACYDMFNYTITMQHD